MLHQCGGLRKEWSIKIVFNARISTEVASGGAERVVERVVLPGLPVNSSGGGIQYYERKWGPPYVRKLNIYGGTTTIQSQ